MNVVVGSSVCAGVSGISIRRLAVCPPEIDTSDVPVVLRQQPMLTTLGTAGSEWRQWWVRESIQRAAVTGPGTRTRRGPMSRAYSRTTPSPEHGTNEGASTHMHTLCGEISTSIMEHNRDTVAMRRETHI